MARDIERTATYRAETHAFADTAMARRLTIDEADDLVGRVVAHSWWATRGLDARPITVVEGRSAHTSWWRAADRRMQLSPDDLALSTISHELAHAADRSAGEPSHGAGFRRAHVDIVALLAGRVPADQLLRAYQADGLAVAAGDALSRVADALTVLDPRPFNVASVSPSPSALRPTRPNG